MGVNKKVMRLAGIGSTFGRPEANFVHAQAGSSAQKVLLPEAEEPETRKRAPTAYIYAPPRSPLEPRRSGIVSQVHMCRAAPRASR